MSNAYIIYTDGSTVNNGKEGARGGYGVVFVSERSLDTSGYFTDGPQTKCRYELEAIATEIALDVHNHHILIKTGSENSKKSITTWLKTWKQNGFITAKGKPVQLRWLFEEIDQNIINIRAHGNIVAFQHVEEHVTDEFHIEASCLAKTAAAKNAHDEGVKLTLLEDRTLQLELDENIDFMQKNLHLKDSMTQWFPMMISGAGKEYPSEIEQILYKFLELCSKIDLPESVKAVVPSSSTEPGTQHLRAHIEPIRLFLSTGKPSNRDSLEKLFHDVKKSICIGQKAYIIYTDGSALNENKEGARGGYGVVFESERARDTSGHFADGPQTNNRYELEAIKIATEVALDVHNHHILIRTDSEISIRCVTENVKKWVTNGFINSNGKPVQNRRLIEEIDDNIINIRAQGKMIQFEHVSGRDSNIYSKDAYRLARTAALNAREIEFKSYIIYTDGSTVDNGKEGARGGYGVVCLFDRQLDTSGSFSFGNQTNNRYELEAIKKAIDIIRRVNHNHFIIRTDSEYSLKSVTEYVKAWKKNGWKTASGEDVKNKKLIEKIHRYVMMLADRGKIVKFEHVKGHGTDEFNIEADRLARAAATGSDAIHEETSSDEEDFYYTPITHSYDVDVEAMQAYFAKQLQLHVDHLTGANKNLEEQAEKPKPYIIYVKSSIAYHTGKARCGYAVVCASDRDKDAYGYFQHGKQTKQRYELEGFFVATEMARTGKDMYYIFKCDSQDTLKMITESLEIWKQNDWKTSSGEPVQHRGLLQSIDRNLRKLRSQGVKIEFKHVRGNGMDYYNNIADELAQIGGNNNPVDTGEVVPAGLYQPTCL